MKRMICLVLALLLAAFTLTALANSWALLRNTFGPAWPEPAAPEAGDDDDEL